MQVQDKQDPALKSFVRSLRTALKDEHAFDVPYTALRAGVLRAQGENPHAFSLKSKSTPFVAVKDKLLKKGAASRMRLSDPAYQLWMHASEDGFRLSLDPMGDFWIPDNCRLANATMVSQRVAVFKLEKRGFPKSFQDAGTFYKKHFGIAVAGSSEDSQAVRVGAKTLEKTALLVRMPQKDWLKALTAVLENSNADVDAYGTIAEWVATHYKLHFESLTPAVRADYLARYLGTGVSTQLDLEREVILEWVYPDEDSDCVEATLNVLSGEVTAKGKVPEDALSSMVRVRILIDDAYDFGVLPMSSTSTNLWLVRPSDLPDALGSFPTPEV